MKSEEIASKVAQAIEAAPKRKFTQSIEVGFGFTGVNVQDDKHKLNSNLVLPKGRGREQVVGFFADGDMGVRAKEFSQYVYDRSQLEELGKKRGEMRKIASKCNHFIAQPDLMPLIGRHWGIVLGPRNKMPQPIPPNADLAPVVARLNNTVRVRTKKNPSVHVAVGTEEMSPEDVAANVKAAIDEVEKKIPLENIKTAYVKTTMGPAVRLW